ncbi:MAG TPA: hypothetical protein VIJ82_10535 [Streptosporangiaceae bacterium]|jgi:hypothetical protein
MYNVLRIEGEPASWILENAQIEEVARELGQSGRPVILEVVAPLQGRLVLSAKAAGSVALLGPPGGAGWTPGGVILPRAHLYVPSATGPTAQEPGYALAQSADLHKLEHDIVTAMRHGTMVTVGVSEGLEDGVLVLNGAALPLAVLCPPSRPGPAAPS